MNKKVNSLLSPLLGRTNNIFLIGMRVSMLLLCIGLTSVYAHTSNAQAIDIDLKDVPITTFFREIQEKSDYVIIYRDEVIADTKKVTVRASSATLETILTDVLAPLGLGYEIIDRQVIINKKGPSIDDTGSNTIKTPLQTTVNGTITDAEGIPLPGANIVEKGTTNGATADFDGNFSLVIADEDAILTVSYIGFATKEVAVNGQATVNVQLEESAAGLDEVVVVGYGSQRKKTLSGAVSSIDTEEITTTKTENLVSDIQGKIPGLLIRQQTAEPGTFNSMVSIRGFGSPLVVIDGVPRDGTADMAQLNPADVESISILKDASAAIYGMNAANGVIVITTKKGRSGKPQFSYSNLFGMKGATGMESTVDAYTYRVMRNEMDRNIGNAPSFGEEVLEKYRSGEPGYGDTDWIDLTLHDWVFQQQHNFSVRGGSDNVRYFASMNYTEDNGLLKSDIQKYRRYNFRSNMEADLTSNLTANISFSGRLNNTQSPRNAFLWVFKPIMVNDRGQNYHTIANESHMTALPPENTNPFAMMSPDIDGYRRENEMQYRTSVDLTYTVPFVPGLEASVLGAFDTNTRRNSMLQKSYGLYDYYTDERTTTYGTDQYSNTINLFTRKYIRGMLNYKRTMADVHNLEVMGAVEYTHTRSDYLTGARQYADLYTHDILDQGTSTTATNAGNRSFGILAAYFSRLNYNYAGKYLLEVVARYDGSSRYSNAKRWAFFPSVSAGWRISDETFIKDNIPVITELKLRASYGESGLDAGDAFEYIAGYTASSSSGYIFRPNELTIGMIAPGVVNENLSWISSKTTDIGIDFNLDNGKLSGNVDVFERKNSGLLATRIQTVPNTFGASFPQENINSDLTHGIELALAHRGEIGQDFSYFVNINGTYSRRKVLHDERAAFGSSWDRWKNGNENRYTGRMWNYEYDGKYTALEQYETAPLMGGNQGNSRMLPGSFRLTDTNNDGIINSDDQTPDHWTFGQVNPPLQFGMNLGGSYKSFDFNVLFQGAALYSINYRNNDIWGYGRYPSLHEKFLDRWHTVNPEANPYDPASQWEQGHYPALRTNFSGTTDSYRIDVWTPPATYVRLKNVELGYNLPQNLLEKLKMTGVRFFVNGFNLLTFTNKELQEADPERQESDWDANLTYPLMQSFNIGINATF